MPGAHAPRAVAIGPVHRGLRACAVGAAESLLRRGAAPVGRRAARPRPERRRARRAREQALCDLAARPSTDRDAMTTMKPGVLLVMGAYYPELSGAGLQTRSLVRTLADRVDFTVLTTTADASLALADRQDGIEVYRIPVNPASAWSKLAAIVRFTNAFVRLSRRFSIVHLHGFSQKSILVVALARLARKKI